MNSSKNTAISHGTRRYSNYLKRIYTSQIRKCQGRIGKAEGKGTGKKGNGADRYGVCQARIKESERSLKAVGRKRGEVQVVNFISICTSFTYQDRGKYDKIYQDKVLRENAWNTRKYKETRGYTKICKEKLKCSSVATVGFIGHDKILINQMFSASPAQFYQ